MKRNGKKLVAVLGLVSILGTSIFTGAIAAGTDVKGKLAKMNIFNNGTTISLQKDPIIIDGTTYLPVRALGEALGNQIDWYPAEPNNIYISGTTNQTEFNQMAVNLNLATITIAEKDSKIKDLEAKIKTLEEDAKKDTVTGSNLRTFENSLNRDYKDYKGTRLDITLKEKSKDIVADITINSNYYVEWEDLTETERKRLIEDVVYDLQREYKNARIEGYLYGGFSTYSYDFYTDNSDRLQIGAGTGSGSSSVGRGDFPALERFLADEYSDEISSVKIKESGKTLYADVYLRYKNETTATKDWIEGRVRYWIDRDINHSKRYDNVYVYFE